MSFDLTVEYLSDYAKSRTDGITNCRRLCWSTDSVETYSDLIGKFDRADDDALWSKLKADFGDYGEITSVRNRIAFTAGVGRDVRSQFCSAVVSDGKVSSRTQRSPIAILKYEIMRLSFISKYVLAGLKRRIGINSDANNS